jgi:hypothetical protein
MKVSAEEKIWTRGFTLICAACPSQNTFSLALAADF